jgi:AbrB family looped-hinge helix DNA binding protein
MAGMRSTITSRGQTVIPAEIRRRFHLTASDRLEWIVEEGCLKVIPVKADPIQAFRGQGKGGGVDRLLKERRNDLRSE